MKEDIKKKHGYMKSKELFAFDDGYHHLTAVRPIVAALEALDMASEGDEDVSRPEPEDLIKIMLENAVALLGNAVFRLNSWRQRRFSEYLTDLGKRILKSDLPADKHLFPDRFHKVVQSERDHSQTNSKLVTAPVAEKNQFKKSFTSKQPFRRLPFQSSFNKQKRTWGNKG